MRIFSPTPPCRCISPPRSRPYWQFSPYPEHAKEMTNYDYVLVVDHPKFQVPNGLSLVPIKQGMTYVLSRIERH